MVLILPELYPLLTNLILLLYVTAYRKGAIELVKRLICIGRSGMNTKVTMVSKNSR
jgi:hypothetical protein